MADTKEFDPVKAGQEEAAKNAKADKKASDSEAESLGSTVTDAQKLAKKNARLDDGRRGEAKMSPQDVGTSERDIPEGAPVTDQPEESEGEAKEATSKDADEKKDLPDDEKRQDTDKDSATPSPSATNSPKQTPANSSADKK